MRTGVPLSTGFFVADASTRTKRPPEKRSLITLSYLHRRAWILAFAPPSRNRTTGSFPSHPASIPAIRRSARPRRLADKTAETSFQLAWSVFSTDIHAPHHRNSQPLKKRHP